jgi:hypothetical protein
VGRSLPRGGGTDPCRHRRPCLGDDLDRVDVYAAAERAEARLQMPVNPVLRPADSWADPAGDALMTEIQARPYLDLSELAS